MDLSVFGLVIILFAWFWQLWAVAKGKKNLQLGFLLLYAIGVVMLVWNNLIIGYLNAAAWLNLADIVIVVILMLKTQK